METYASFAKAGTTPLKRRNSSSAGNEDQHTPSGTAEKHDNIVAEVTQCLLLGHKVSEMGDPAISLDGCAPLYVAPEIALRCVWVQLRVDNGNLSAVSTAQLTNTTR